VGSPTHLYVFWVAKSPLMVTHVYHLHGRVWASPTLSQNLVRSTIGQVHYGMDPMGLKSVRVRTQDLGGNQWRNDRGAEGGSCPRAQQARGRKIGGTKVSFMQFVE